jgi:hypothetical protein
MLQTIGTVDRTGQERSLFVGGRSNCDSSRLGFKAERPWCWHAVVVRESIRG